VDKISKKIEIKGCWSWY